MFDQLYTLPWTSESFSVRATITIRYEKCARYVWPPLLRSFLRSLSLNNGFLLSSWVPAVCRNSVPSFLVSRMVFYYKKLSIFFSVHWSTKINNENAVNAKSFWSKIMSLKCYALVSKSIGTVGMTTNILYDYMNFGIIFLLLYTIFYYYRDFRLLS